jgi:hypothetical protein
LARQFYCRANFTRPGRSTQMPDEEIPDELICHQDDVSVSPDDPRCFHPSSLCPFRDHCEVIRAARRKRRLAEDNPDQRSTSDTPESDGSSKTEAGPDS